MRALAFILFCSLIAVTNASAQAIDGDWQGTLKAGPAEIRVVLHVVRGEKGGLTATLDSPDQGAKGIPVTSITLTDATFKFEVQPISGAYEGKVNAGATAITGTWTQPGASLPLDLTRAVVVQARTRVAKPSDIDGDWEGSLQGALRLVLHITTFEDGMTATLDSPDQNALGLPVTSIVRDRTSLRFEMKQLAGSFDGTLDAALSSVDGTWTQRENSLPLVLTRRKTP